MSPDGQITLPPEDIALLAAYQRASGIPPETVISAAVRATIDRIRRDHHLLFPLQLSPVSPHCLTCQHCPRPALDPPNILPGRFG